MVSSLPAHASELELVTSTASTTKGQPVWRPYADSAEGEVLVIGGFRAQCPSLARTCACVFSTGAQPIGGELSPRPRFCRIAATALHPRNDCGGSVFSTLKTSPAL